jgi:hypothetical protein
MSFQMKNLGCKPNLQIFSASGCFHNAKDLDWSDFVQVFPNLTKLELFQCGPELNASCISNISKLSLMTSLRLHANANYPENIAPLCKLQLSELFLHYSQIDDSFLNMLPNSLQTLSLERTIGYSDQGLISLFQKCTLLTISCWRRSLPQRKFSHLCREKRRNSRSQEFKNSFFGP